MVVFNIGHNVIHLSKTGLSLRRKAIVRTGRKMRHSGSTPAIWDENNLIRLSYTYTTLGYVKRTKTVSLTTTHFMIFKQFVTYLILNFESS